MAELFEDTAVAEKTKVLSAGQEWRPEDGTAEDLVGEQDAAPPAEAWQYWPLEELQPVLQLSPPDVEKLEGLGILEAGPLFEALQISDGNLLSADGMGRCRRYFAELFAMHPAARRCGRIRRPAPAPPSPAFPRTRKPSG